MCCQIHLYFLLVQDSFASVIVPLKDDVLLQEKYVTFKGYVRLGRLLEDMDMFAGKYQLLPVFYEELSTNSNFQD
jgi:hypothetical protein